MSYLNGNHYILIMMDTVYDFRNARVWIYLKRDRRSSSFILRKSSLSPRRGSNPQHADNRWDGLTIELPRLRWWARCKFDIFVLSNRSHYKIIMIYTVYDFRNVRAWIYLKRDERSSSSILRKWFLSPRRGSNPQPSDDRWDALTIELPRLRWWARCKFDIFVQPNRKPLYIYHDLYGLWF